MIDSAQEQRQCPELPTSLWAHGLVLTAWFVTFVIHTTFVAVRRPSIHRRFGWIVAGLGVAVFAVSMLVTLNVAPRQRAGVFVVPVLATSDGFLLDGGRAGLLADARFQPFLSPNIVEQLKGTFAASATADSDTANRVRFESSREAVRNLHNVGVKLLVGTDAALLNPTAHGVSLHRELELLSAAGLTNVETLSSATMNTAEAFRLSDRGRILPGKRADLLLVRGDPMMNILATRDILRIWKSGIEVDRRPLGRQ